MEIITSINNQLIKDINQLRQKKIRTIKKQFIVEGIHLTEEAYKNNLLKIVLAIDDEYLKKFLNIRCIKVTEQIIEKLSTTTSPQPVIGVVDMIDNRLQKSNKYLVLDGINDPGNLGTIIRTSLALGINNLILSHNTVDVYNEKVLRATQGAIFKANIYYCELSDIYPTLKEQNIKIITTSLKAKKELKDLAKFDSFALVVGDEANGVSKLSLDNADELVIIPIKNDIESLNVAVATSIILYSLLN